VNAAGAPPDRLFVVGAGKVGLALGLALHRAGAASSLVYASRKDAPPPHPLFEGDDPPARIAGRSLAPPPGVTGVLLAVPDRAVADAAAEMARHDLPPGVPVLHTSGTLGLEPLAPLAARGVSVGSVHPLAAVSDPVAGVERLRGAAFGVEAEGGARALAERIVTACGGTVLEVAHGGKPLYHAAAVFAANYAVALLGVAERLMTAAGVDAADARAALAGLAAGAVANVAEHGTAAALTGPVARGDDDTVRLHLSRLSARDGRVYSLLGREALVLATAAGLGEEAAERVRRALGDEA
jgi:predicted short-subunit dehydrogenase-like oxidoreductase (DUF2520 family)